MFHAYIIPFTTCFIYTSYHFYAFSGTNLLTRCHSASSLFSAVFGFRKLLLEIFSELHETKGQVPIFPTRTRSPKEKRRGARRWPNHRLARQWAPPRRLVVWAPRGSADIAPSPIYSPRRENPKTPSLSSRTYSLPPPSSTLTRGVPEALPGTLPERGIITGGLYIAMPASGVMRE